MGGYLLAVDPGNVESAWALVDTATYNPVDFGKTSNDYVRTMLRYRGDNQSLIKLETVAIEMVASYGMAVGADVFETCVEIGRFAQIVLDSGQEARLVYRRDIKLHHCGNPRANDSNITQALVDRFASGQPNRGKGTKKDPGWFHGFRADVWQAYALAVYVADTTRAVAA